MSARLPYLSRFILGVELSVLKGLIMGPFSLDNNLFKIVKGLVDYVYD